jgi:hypothetical protein
MVQVGEDSLVENYALRSKDEHVKLSGKTYNWS